MLTRLRVKGFKNLLDADVRFGPFTCIAGLNGVGKSNLFDAIHFLSLLTSRGLVEAAQFIRDDDGRSGDVRGLFYRHGDMVLPEMEFVADMITPKEGVDTLRQVAKATSTFLRYTLRIGYRGEDSPYGSLEVRNEELSYISKGEAGNEIAFEHAAKAWRNEVVVDKRRAKESRYIHTKPNSDGQNVVYIQQDGTQGRPQPRLAEPLPRTVLSSLSASEAKTAVLARNEMASWRLLQLEPSAMRRADDFRSPTSVSSDGSHMPATLHRLLTNGRSGASEATRQRIANRVAGLVGDLADVNVERDDKRELITLVATLQDGTLHPARALSDGTLRFLALAIIEQSADATGLFCLEEPENGISPSRVQAMLGLLQEIAVDPHESPGPDNPQRQVIVNTHSPIVVARVPDDSLLVAEQAGVSGEPFGLVGVVPTVRFSALPNTWRIKAGAPECAKGRLIPYLNPIGAEPLMSSAERSSRSRSPLVRDRSDLQMLLPFLEPRP